VIAQKTIATPRASCNEIELSPCWKNVKEDSEFEEVILFLELISQWLGVHKGTFQGDGGNNLSSQKYPHMHDQFEMISEGTK
jgi:hypothetical protein